MRFRDWVTAIACLAAIAVSIFAVGGVPRWAQAIAALCVALAIAATLPSRRGLRRASPLIIVITISIAITAIQLLPLPAGILESLSPTAMALREDGAALMGISPWPSLTTDVPQTLTALVFFTTLLGIAHITLRVATTERGRYRILVAIGTMCGLTAGIVGIHQLFGLRALYGLYEPDYAAPRMMGPLLNGNSLACLTAAGAMIAIGLAAYRRQKGWLRVIWLIVVAGCGAVTVATVSRGATIAFAAGSLVTIAILIGQRILSSEGSRRRRSRFVTNALPIGILAGCMVVLVIFTNASMVERQLSQLSTQEFHQTRSKFAAWKSAMTLIEESPWLGIGRGAFESNFTRVHAPSGLAIYSHLENEYVQAVVDFGVPGALAIGLAMIWLAVLAVRRWRDGPLTAGALGALTVVAMQSNVDFGLELLGLAAPVVAIAATVTYVPLRDPKYLNAARFGRVIHVLALLAGALLMFTSATTSLPEDHEALRARPTIAMAREVLERHPLDYYGYAVAAEQLDRNNDPRAIKLLNHALRMHPTHPGLHRLAALMLSREGFTAQATIEYGEALRNSLDARKLLREILARFSPEQAASAIPLDYGDPAEIVRIISDLGHTHVAILWLTRVLSHQPKSSRACDLLFMIALRDQSHEAARLVSDRCLSYMPDYQTRLATAQLLASSKAHANVIKLLADVETWQTRVDDKIDAWLALCDAHAALETIDEAKRCLRRLDASPDMRLERRLEIMKRLEAFQKPPLALEALGSSAATGSAVAP